MTKKKKDPRGGPGRNQGRKKGAFTEPTRVIRVPVALFPDIEKMVSDRKINLTVTNMVDYKEQARRVKELTKEINSLAVTFAKKHNGKTPIYFSLSNTCAKLEEVVEFLKDEATIKS
jgi:hypothetical protein